MDPKKGWGGRDWLDEVAVFLQWWENCGFFCGGVQFGWKKIEKCSPQIGSNYEVLDFVENIAEIFSSRWLLGSLTASGRAGLIELNIDLPGYNWMQKPVDSMVETDLGPNCFVCFFGGGTVANLS